MSNLLVQTAANFFMAGGHDQMMALVALKLLAGEHPAYDRPFQPLPEESSASREAFYQNFPELRTPITEVETLEAALLIWGWRPTFDAQGNIVDLTLLYEYNHGGTWDICFGAIAPYLRKGSFLEVEGEENGRRINWRWIFDGYEARPHSPRRVTQQRKGKTSEKVVWEKASVHRLL